MFCFVERYWFVFVWIVSGMFVERYCVCVCCLNCVWNSFGLYCVVWSVFGMCLNVIVFVVWRVFEMCCVLRYCVVWIVFELFVWTLMCVLLNCVWTVFERYWLVFGLCLNCCLNFIVLFLNYVWNVFELYYVCLLNCDWSMFELYCVVWSVFEMCLNCIDALFLNCVWTFLLCVCVLRIVAGLCFV